MKKEEEVRGTRRSIWAVGSCKVQQVNPDALCVSDAAVVEPVMLQNLSHCSPHPIIAWPSVMAVVVADPRAADMILQRRFFVGS